MAGYFAFAERQGHLTSCMKINVAVIFENENELINYIPFGLDINAWHSPEKTKLYFPSHKAFRRSRQQQQY